MEGARTIVGTMFRPTDHMEETAMPTDSFSIKVDNKHYWFVRTEKHWFDFTNRQILTDGSIEDNDGLVPIAEVVSSEYVAELVAKSSKTRAKVSRIEKLRKELLSE